MNYPVEKLISLVTSEVRLNHVVPKRYPSILSGLLKSVVHLRVRKQTVVTQDGLQMKNFDATQLSHFTGTERYYRISRRHLLTDGTKYLAEAAECFWMMDAVASHLSEIGTDDWFVQVRMTVNDNRATMIYEDGNGKEHARQEIPFTDFPMPSVSMYACWDGEHWVIMMPGEY